MPSGNVIELDQGALKIVKFNKPGRKNALDRDMYIEITDILTRAAEDGNISIVVLTGVGDYYSSGNDFKAAAENPEESNIDVLHAFVSAFITFPKILIGVVNGPAIGIAATTLALCDLVFAAEKSYIYTPFTKLGIVAEGCSTYTFPKLMGERKATELLMLNHKMPAKEALACGFVNYVYKPNEMKSVVWDTIADMTKLSYDSLMATKSLIRGAIQEDLLITNDNEMEALNYIWQSNGTVNMFADLIKKSKL